MISDGDSAISYRLGPSDKFKRDKFTVTENSMGMQIYHHKKIQEYTRQCKGNEKCKPVPFLSLKPQKHWICHLLFRPLASQGANFKRGSMPGMAINTQKIKKFSHPICFARKPVGAEASTLGTPIRLLKSAYWVAVNFLFVMLPINAAYAAVPMPPVRFSNAMTPERAGRL